MKNFENYLKISVAIIFCCALANEIHAQQTGNPLMGLSTRPIEYVDFNNNDAVENIPSHNIDGFDPNDESTWDEDDHSLLSEKYGGQSPQFAYQVVNDKYGNPLLFIVDDFIYNEDGEGFDKPGIGYYNLHGDDNIFNPYNYSCDYGLYQNIVVIPDKSSCNSFYIFYALLEYPEGVGSDIDMSVYYRKLTYINENEIIMTDPSELNNDFDTGCLEFSNFTMNATSYNDEYDDYLLIIQYLGEVFINKIDGDPGNCTYKKLVAPDSKEGELFFRINPVLKTINDDIVFIYPSVSATDSWKKKLTYFRFSRDYNQIDPQDFDYDCVIYDNNNKIRGLKMSPDGNYLYTTQDGQTGFQVFDLQDYIAGIGSPPAQYSTIGSGNFEDSDLFLGRDNKIYAVEELSGQSYLSTINDPDNPFSTTITSQVLSITNIYKSLIGSYFDRIAYIFPSQIDQSDYSTNYPVKFDEIDWSTIGDNETWSPGNNPFDSESGIVCFNTDFEIPSGKSITLQDMEFHFDNTMVEVNTNAELSLYNTKFTAETGCNSDAMISGIILKGNPSLDQSLSNQSYFYMDNDSEISNNFLGVIVEGGAICHVYGGDFINNRNGITFLDYTHPTNPNYNWSLVQNANFETSRLMNTGDNFEYHINLSDVKGVDVKYCDFSNTRNNSVQAEQRKRAISIGQSTTTTIKNCSFNGFNYGIRVYGATPDIINSDFSNNYRSLLVRNSTLANIQGNTFDGNYSFDPPDPSNPSDPNEDENYSVYIAGDGISNSIYEFKENSFTKGDIGAVFYNTGENSAEIRDNNFDDINGVSNAAATLVMGQNSDYDGTQQSGETGLQFRCNQYTNYPYALSVIDGNMRRYQGEQNASTGEDYAGNYFDHSGYYKESDFYVDHDIDPELDLGTYDYYSHADDPHKILNYTGTKINNNEYTDPYSSEDCDEDSGGGIVPGPIKGKTVNEGISDINTLDSEIMLKEYELEEQTDNGETYIMLSEAETMNASNSSEVAEDISSLDGYISDELAVTYMQNENGNQYEKAGALLENSPLPSNSKSEIDGMTMNQNLKQILQVHQQGKNIREIKKAEIAQLKQTRGLIVKEMVHRVIHNDSLQAETNDLIAFLANDNDLGSSLHLYKLYKAKNRWQDAGTCLNNMRNEIQNYGIDRMTELENYLEIQEIMLDIEQGNSDVETAVSNNLAFLQTLANTESAPGEITAQVLLEQAGVDTFPEVIRLPEPVVQPKNLTFDDSENDDFSQDVNELVNVYPNPASDNIYIEYAFLNSDKSRDIRIYNTNGVLIDKIKIEQAIGLINYNKDMPAGNYIIKVGKNHSQRVTIL